MSSRLSLPHTIFNVWLLAPQIPDTEVPLTGKFTIIDLEELPDGIVNLAWSAILTTIHTSDTLFLVVVTTHVPVEGDDGVGAGVGAAVVGGSEVVVVVGVVGAGLTVVVVAGVVGSGLTVVVDAGVVGSGLTVVVEAGVVGSGLTVVVVSGVGAGVGGFGFGGSVGITGANVGIGSVPFPGIGCGGN